MVALASAFVRLRPQVDDRDYQKAGEQAGRSFGKPAGQRAAEGIDEGLEAAKKRAVASGGEAGRVWAEGFRRDANGKIRDAQGKFVNSSIATGEEAGKGFGKSFGKGSSGIVDSIKSNLKLAAGVFVPLGLAAAAGEIGKIGIAYENNLNIFKSVSKATAAEMDAVAEKARQLGSDIELPGVSAAGASAAMTELAKAGFSVQEAMDAAKGTLQLARVANLSEAEAAEIAANAVNAFGIQAKDTTFVVDELAAAANSSSLEISEASQSFKQAAAVFSGLQARVVGPKEAITELNTAIAILGNNGIKGSDAGTSLKQMLLQLTGPSEMAKNQMQLLAARAAGATISLEQQHDALRGGKKVREAALEAIKKQNSAMDLEGDIAYDSAGKMRPLREIIDLVARGTRGMTQAESDFAITQIFGADASRAVLALLKGGLPVYDDMRKAIITQGAAADFAKAKNAGLGGAIDAVRGQIENAAIEVYNVVKGPLTTGLNAFAAALPGIFNGIRDVIKFLYDNRAAILAAAYAYGVYRAALAATIAQQAIVSAGGFVSFLTSKLIPAIRGVTTSQVALNVAMLANPVGIVVIAIAALVAAIVIAYRNSERFRNIVQSVWAAIKTAIGATVSWITGTAVPFILRAWGAIQTAAMFLWRNVIQPVWRGISAAVSTAIDVIKAVLKVVFVQFNVLTQVVRFLYNNVFRPIFIVLAKVVEIWWLAVRIIFNAFRIYLTNVVFPTIRFFYDKVVKPIFSAVGSVISAWWNNVVKPVFGFFRTAFGAVGKTLSDVWTKIIRPMFQQFGGFITGTVAPQFQRGVDAIRKAWEKVQEAARKPVAFVVNHVINPFIVGLNQVAGLVGIKKEDQIDTIKGFARGGQIPGPANPSGRDNRLASITGTGRPIAVASKEFITNVRSTMANLPLVKAINAKRGKVTHADVDPYLDGYAGGGMIGDGIGDAWDRIKRGAQGAADFITNPGEALRKVAEAALSRIPGGGMLKEVVAGGARKIIGRVGTFLKDKLAGGGTGIGGTSVLGGWQGMQRLIAARFPGLGLISGFRPGAVTVGGNASYHGKGRAVDYPPSRALASWIKATFGRKTKELITPFQDLNLHNGKPHHYTGAVWRTHNFAGGNAHVHWAAQLGGLVDKLRSGMPVKMFDSGGAWPSGTIGVNTSGRTEYVDPNRSGTSMADVVDLLERVERAILGDGDRMIAAQRVTARRTGRAARSGAGA